MHFRTFMGMAAAAASLAFAGAAQADTVVYNSAPAAGWNYGSGNNYTPNNSAVLTTDAGDQLFLRAHETFQKAPASTGDTYSFPTGLSFISFDWGFTSHTGAFDGLTAVITLTNYAGGSGSFDPYLFHNDNVFEDGTVSNSARLNWFGIDPSVDGSYGVELAVNGLEGGTKSLSIRIDVGDGYQTVVPEPSTWALMVLAFGGAGAALRRQRRTLAAA